jgi:hypothetical protein
MLRIYMLRFHKSSTFTLREQSEIITPGYLEVCTGIGEMVKVICFIRWRGGICWPDYKWEFYEPYI